MKQTILAAMLVAALGASNVLAHGGSDDMKQHAPRERHASVEQTPFGRAGDPAKVTRTVTVDMSDAMRFDPAQIRVRRGETVKFVVKNSGQLLHEMVLGTAQSLREHAEMMRKFPDMEHDEPHMIHVQTGKSGEMVWQFNRAGEFGFGCLIPGHYEAGMAGKIEVTK